MVGTGAERSNKWEKLNSYITTPRWKVLRLF